MSNEDLKAKVRQWWHGINQPDWEQWVRSLMDPEDADAFIAEHSVFRKSFPDYQFSIVELLVDGDHVAIYGTARGTHMAEFPLADLKGVMATQKTIEWPEAHFFRVEKNKALDYHLLVDSYARMEQLGLIPVR